MGSTATGVGVLQIISKNFMVSARGNSVLISKRLDLKGFWWRILELRLP